MASTKSILSFVFNCILVIGLFTTIVIAGAFSEKEEFIKCDRNKDVCVYYKNTYIDPTIVEVSSFKISDIISCKPNIEQRRGRKGRVSYRNIIELNLSNGKIIKYPLSLKSEYRSTYVYKNFSNYLSDDASIYYEDYVKVNSSKEETIIIILMIFFLIFGLYGNYKKAFHYNN